MSGGFTNDDHLNRVFNKLEYIFKNDPPSHVARNLNSLLTSSSANRPGSHELSGLNQRYALNQFIPQQQLNQAHGLQNSRQRGGSEDNNNLEVIEHVLRNDPRSLQAALSLCQLFEYSNANYCTALHRSLTMRTNALQRKFEEIFYHDPPKRRFTRELNTVLDLNSAADIGEVQIANYFQEFLSTNSESLLATSPQSPPQTNIEEDLNNEHKDEQENNEGQCFEELPDMSELKSEYETHDDMELGDGAQGGQDISQQGNQTNHQRKTEKKGFWSRLRKFFRR